ncbi:transglycosylase domain-containing protein [Patescibacteria group bacterium]|nr:transglycosylase domain-containing protein [Patescibacteria group bacterium]MBU1703411.1 transglycosylase domain-containing protein [Patescibacteria group bacterium]MBU1953862.1 transglycosylase domain-containing protein [Patescibacteria group bacterium]
MVKKKQKKSGKKKSIKKVRKNVERVQELEKIEKVEQIKEVEEIIEQQPAFVPEECRPENKLSGVQLKEKIALDSSHHSLRNYFNRRYGKYAIKYKRPAFTVLKIAGALFGLFALSLTILFLVFGRDLPDVSKLKDINFSETTTIYDREGNVLYSIFNEENRKYVPLSYISKDAIHATLAIEDKNFYQHLGFDIFSIIRAQMKNIEQDDIKQGASTITQQLAKNIFLSPERTYERKIKELLISLQIEWLFSKDDILEMYLNKIPYGSNAFGIEAASKTFFGKTVSDLTLAESAVLASLPKAPSYFSPYGQNRKELMGYCGHGDDSPREGEVIEDTSLISTETPMDPATVKSPAPGNEDTEESAPAVQCSGPDDPNYVWGRKDAVLQRMVEDRYISREQMLAAWDEGLRMVFLDPVHKIEAPHFVFYVKELLEEKFGKELVESGGLEVVTSLDPRMQSLAEDVIEEHAASNQSRFGANNAALVSIDPRTGQVLAMVGSRNYWDSDIDGQVNIVTSYRQPGSSFKPLVYAAAIQNGGIGSGTMLGDYKTVFNNNYIPKNSDDQYKGNMTVRNALAQSRNIPAIKAFYIAGEEEKLLDFLDKLGVTRLREFKNEFNQQSNERGWTFNYGPAMAIGSGEVSLLQLLGGYATLANGGVHAPVNPILEVRNRDGEILEQFEDKSELVMDQQAAFIVNNILSDPLARPAGSWRSTLSIEDHTVAAKTGTSNKKVGKINYPNNLLTLGYTPSIAVGVWVGNADGSKLSYTSWGLTAAAPIWKTFMETILKGTPDEPFPEPEGLIWKGKEVFPGFMESKNYDAQFKKKEEEPDVPESDFVLTRSDSKKQTDSSTNEDSSGGAASEPAAVLLPEPAPVPPSSPPAELPPVPVQPAVTDSGVSEGF